MEGRRLTFRRFHLRAAESLLMQNYIFNAASVWDGQTCLMRVNTTLVEALDQRDLRFKIVENRTRTLCAIFKN